MKQERKHENRLRYRIEQTILKNIYFNDRINFLDAVIGEKDALYKQYDRVYRENGMQNPYLPDQFSVKIKCMSDGASAVAIHLPEPEEPQFCYRIYAFFGKGLEKTGYFCIEKHEKDYMQGPVIGRWMRDGAYVEYGAYRASQEEEFLKCIEFYKDNSLKAAAEVLLLEKAS